MTGHFTSYKTRPNHKLATPASALPAVSTWASEPVLQRRSEIQNLTSR
jgi:hypothetical protein